MSQKSRTLFCEQKYTLKRIVPFIVRLHFHCSIWSRELDIMHGNGEENGSLRYELHEKSADDFSDAREENGVGQRRKKRNGKLERITEHHENPEGHTSIRPIMFIVS